MSNVCKLLASSRYIFIYKLARFQIKAKTYWDFYYSKYFMISLKHIHSNLNPVILTNKVLYQATILKFKKIRNP